jgi:hypothetical protein
MYNSCLGGMEKKSINPEEVRSANQGRQKASILSPRNHVLTEPSVNGGKGKDKRKEEIDNAQS